MFSSEKQAFLLSSSLSTLFHVTIILLLSQILCARFSLTPPLKNNEPFLVFYETVEEKTLSQTESTTALVEEPIPLDAPEPTESQEISTENSPEATSEKTMTTETTKIVENSENLNPIPQTNFLHKHLQQWWENESKTFENLQRDIENQTHSRIEWFSRQTIQFPRYVSEWSKMQTSRISKANASFPKPKPTTLAKTVLPAQKEKPPEVLFREAYLKKKLPLRYPAFAERMGYEGLVKLRVYLSETGAVQKIEILESSSCEVLDKSAQEQVSQWLFEPAFRGESPIESTLQIPIRFKLN